MFNVTNPNVFIALLVALFCQSVQHSRLLNELPLLHIGVKIFDPAALVLTGAAPFSLILVHLTLAFDTAQYSLGISFSFVSLASAVAETLTS